MTLSRVGDYFPVVIICDAVVGVVEAEYLSHWGEGKDGRDCMTGTNTANMAPLQSTASEEQDGGCLNRDVSQPKCQMAPIPFCIATSTMSCSDIRDAESAARFSQSRRTIGCRNAKA